MGSSLLPIKGRAMDGTEGVLRFSSDEPRVWVQSGPELADVPDAYAVYVVGTHMEPIYAEGTLLCVNPHVAGKIGKNVVLRVSTDGIEELGYICRLLSFDDKVVTAERHNPPEKLTFLSEHVLEIHQIIWARQD
jgi:phage repressor protein C with HTH and peptisase S24 domain